MEPIEGLLFPVLYLSTSKPNHILNIRWSRLDYLLNHTIIPPYPCKEFTYLTDNLNFVTDHTSVIVTTPSLRVFILLITYIIFIIQ